MSWTQLPMDEVMRRGIKLMSDAAERTAKANERRLRHTHWQTYMLLLIIVLISIKIGQDL